MNKEFSLRDVFPLIEEQLNAGGSATFRIHGTSMLPFLSDMRDSVTVVAPTRRIRKHDIVFYRRSNGDFILHRVVGRKKGLLLCRGDNQFDSELVHTDRVVAVVSEYERNGKRKSVSSLTHRIYSLYWVNSALLRRLLTKIRKR